MKTRDSRTEEAEKSAACHPCRASSGHFHRRLSSVLLVLMIVLVAGYGILVLYVPKVAELWARAGADLTPAQQCLVQCSRLAVHNGALVGAPLLLCFIAAFALRLYCLFR